MAIVPHFSLPFRFEADAGGAVHAAVNEQDSIQDVMDCVEAIALCPIGFRLELPNFGIRDQTFTEGSIDIDDLQAAIALWEPRADVLIEEDPSMLDKMIEQIRISPNNTTVIRPTDEEGDDDSIS
jgi:hypothetical protein